MLGFLAVGLPGSVHLPNGFGIWRDDAIHLFVSMMGKPNSIVSAVGAKWLATVR
jgi:hypothetical protein